MLKEREFHSSLVFGFKFEGVMLMLLKGMSDGENG